MKIIQNNNCLKTIKTLNNVLFQCRHIYGYNNKINTVDLTWGMVDRNYHKNGFGRQLTEYRKKIITYFRIRYIIKYYPKYI